MQQQAEALKEWIDDYLINVSYGLQALNTDVSLFSDEDRAKLYEELEAGRFEAKYNGDTIKALEWAIFEEKRRIVNMMVEKVVMTKGENGEKLIDPKLSIAIPADFINLISGDRIIAWEKR